MRHGVSNPLKTYITLRVSFFQSNLRHDKKKPLENVGVTYMLVVCKRLGKKRS